jgi:transcriptional repressor NrdR
VARLEGMKCPFCATDDDRVIDSRLAEDGAAIRRRRECGHCSQRYTTYERVEETALFVVKRSGDREPFDREKLLRGVRAAVKNRGIEEEALVSLVISVEETMRVLNRDVQSEEVGLATLEALRALDEVAFLRFASVYRGYDDAQDFAREIRNLEKTTAPKTRR